QGDRALFSSLQTRLRFLFQGERGVELRPVPNTWLPFSITASHRILESILRGIQQLQQGGHYGEYCAIVAPHLYQPAFRPRSIRPDDDIEAPNGRYPQRTDLTDAPIYQIRPLLREGGFSYSRMAIPGTGVIFSTGGASMYLAVPEDAHVAFVRISR